MCPISASAARVAIPLITWEPWTVFLARTDLGGRCARRFSGRSDAYIEAGRGSGRPTAALCSALCARDANPVYPWAVGNNGNTASDYVAAWRYVRAIFARFHADNVQWVWNRTRSAMLRL
jgi:hypothetical protein